MSEHTSKSRLSLPEPTWAVAGLIVAWGLLISQVRHHWGGESYYNFGYFVPPLAIWLFLRNLSKIPIRDEVPGSKTNSLVSNRWSLILASVVLLPVILFNAFSEVDPFWRVLMWAQGLCLSGFTLVVLQRFYGWAGIRAGIFPLIFLLTMIPWPFRIELWIVQSLTQIVIGFAMEGLHFLSYPVEMAGTNLSLGDIKIGVNEACSGIRSLQALFMVTLFLGSLFGQTLFARVVVLIVLPVIVIIVNTVRAIFLSIQVIVNGQAAYDSWHDPAGYIAFGISMLIIYATIELFNIRGTDSYQSQKVDLKKLVAHWKDNPSHYKSVPYLILPIAVFVIVEGWFRYHEMQVPERNIWQFTPPDSSDPDYMEATFQDVVIQLLGFSYGSHFYYKLSQNSYLDVYHYGYTKDNRLGSASSYGHAPTICMGNTGAILLEEYPQLRFKSGQISLPVHHYKFKLASSDNTIQVFWIFDENRNMNIDPGPLDVKAFSTMWLQLTKGRRDYSRQVLLISCVGIENHSNARQQINEFLGKYISLSED